MGQHRRAKHPQANPHSAPLVESFIIAIAVLFSISGATVKRALLLVALTAFASVASYAADLDGVWKSDKPAQALTLKMADGKVTGTVKSALGILRIAEAKVDGDKLDLTFYVVLDAGVDPLGLGGYDSLAEEGQVTEIHYKGTLSGDTMKCDVEQERLGHVTTL